ncbi:hypothetical protein SARC_06932 [Sphaeroforma arctica JP610]|uniref:Endonuclease/exonuclease/phosphatase domain-containing protein n=1 Tax=Sphaeroforma arctica JP610 TaxID=667725 RepID=A0A0L0FVX4_9EUKA|nr:hypothetical protein SARC_06932 [Sphaeroforma arctica JP610]KNC80711.1 hypothetical protein SARC_06932 [Sphaeroforma arctica JP610]|eukprot:XP_014154613.1 hypothetical protein SARC_06932 [Sphaeroforma arctica JP610]
MESGTNCAIDSSDEGTKDNIVHLTVKATTNYHASISKRPGTASIEVEYWDTDIRDSTKQSLAVSPNSASMEKQRDHGSDTELATNQATMDNNKEVAQSYAGTHELIWARTLTTPVPCNAYSFKDDKHFKLVKECLNAGEKLDAALLQELTKPSLDALETALKKTNYRFLLDPKLVTTYLKIQGGCFNAIVINTATLKVREQSKCLYKFPGSCMGRHVLAVDITTPTGSVAILMTSHLESLAKNSGERVKQMDWVFNHMDTLSIPSIFGGDTNIRVKEVK